MYNEKLHDSGFRPRPGLRLATTLVAGSMVLALTACAGASEEPTEGSSGQLTTVTLALDYLPSPYHNGLAYAMQEGYFEDEGIDLEVLPFSGASADTLVVAGQADVSITPHMGSALLQFAAGAPVKTIYNIQPGNPAMLTVLASSGIETPADLAGTIYGGFGVPTEVAQINEMIAFDGGSGESDSVVLSVGAIEALKSGSVDSAATYPENRIGFETEGIETNDFAFEDYGSPQIGGNLVLASDAWLAEDPDVVRGFVSALRAGYAAADADPEAADLALVAEFPDASLEAADSVASVYVELRENEWGPAGTQSVEAFQAYADYLLERGLLTDAEGASLTAFDPTEFVTNEYLPE